MRLLSGLLLSLICLNLAMGDALAQQGRRLPRAQFLPYGQQAATGSALPRVSGVHLSDGLDRPTNQKGPATPYPPGEPAVHGQLVRWSPKKMPLLVWISPGIKLPDCSSFPELQNTRVDFLYQLLHSGMENPFQGLTQAPGWTPQTNEVVAAGIEQWRDFQNEGLFSYKFCENPRDAHILVFFTDSFKDATSPGGIAVGGNTCAKIFPVNSKFPQMPTVIELSTMVNGTEEKMRAASAHEFGHALGIKAHSEYRDDIMFVDRVVTELSPADKATIRWLYHQVPQWEF